MTPNFLNFNARKYSINPAAKLSLSNTVFVINPLCNFAFELRQGTDYYYGCTDV